MTIQYQVEVLQKCRDSFEYFCDTVFGISHVNVFPSIINPTTDKQAYAYLIWTGIFMRDTVALVVLPTAIQMKYHFDEFSKMQKQAADYLQCELGLKKNSFHTVEFHNRNLIKFQVASENVGRGMSIYTLVLGGNLKDNIINAIFPALIHTNGAILKI